MKRAAVLMMALGALLGATSCTSNDAAASRAPRLRGHGDIALMTFDQGVMNADSVFVATLRSIQDQVPFLTTAGEEMRLMSVEVEQTIKGP